MREPERFDRKFIYAAKIEPVLRAELADGVPRPDVPVERLYAERLVWFYGEAESPTRVIDAADILSEPHRDCGVELEVVVYRKRELEVVPGLIVCLILELCAGMADKDRH